MLFHSFINHKSPKISSDFDAEFSLVAKSYWTSMGNKNSILKADTPIVFTRLHFDDSQRTFAKVIGCFPISKEYILK